MSINAKRKLSEIAKQICRDLRKRATPAEKTFWELVRNRKFCNKKFYRQYPIYIDLLGRESFYIADFFCFEEKLVIEIDGGYHERQKDYDKLRTKVINYQGYRVIRFTNEEVLNNIEKVEVILKNNLKLSMPAIKS